MTTDNIPIYKPYNPLDKRNIGISTAQALLSSPVHQLPPDPFIGAGVYAIYYKGDFPLYEKIALLNQESYNLPIYVGKAVPAGARKGGLGQNVNHGSVLHKRLTEHYSSISSATNLNEDDFYCRFLVIDDIWIPLAESLLIERFKPLWNLCIDGFGNHDPGKGRYNQQRSPWDSIHPGRIWAERLQPNEVSTSEMEERIQFYINSLNTTQNCF